MSELHSFINNVHDLFAEIVNRLLNNEKYFVFFCVCYLKYNGF